MGRFKEEIAPVLRSSRLYALICDDDFSDVLQAAPLTDDEFSELTRAFELPPTGSKWMWEPYEPLYRKHWDTVPEVRRLATPRMLQDWTDACGRFSDRLKGDDLPLAEGLETMHCWIELLRKLVQACSVQPRENAAQQAEPLFDPYADYTALAERMKKAIVEIREAMDGKPGEKPLGKDATSTKLTNQLKMATKTLCDALCWMYVQGEYRPKGYIPKRLKGLKYVESSTPESS